MLCWIYGTCQVLHSFILTQVLHPGSHFYYIVHTLVLNVVHVAFQGTKTNCSSLAQPEAVPHGTKGGVMTAKYFILWSTIFLAQLFSLYPQFLVCFMIYVILWQYLNYLICAFFLMLHLDIYQLNSLYHIISRLIAQLQILMPRNALFS